MLEITSHYRLQWIPCRVIVCLCVCMSMKLTWWKSVVYNNRNDGIFLKASLIRLHSHKDYPNHFLFNLQLLLLMLLYLCVNSGGGGGVSHMLLCMGGIKSLILTNGYCTIEVLIPSSSALPLQQSEVKIFVQDNRSLEVNWVCLSCCYCTAFAVRRAVLRFVIIMLASSSGSLIILIIADRLIFSSAHVWFAAYVLMYFIR